MTETQPPHSGTIAVLPLGATEQHGPHLPFETDTVIAQGIARRAQELLPTGLDVRFLPAEPVGYSPEHMDFAGTRSLGFDEAVERWIGIGRQARDDGSRKFVMLNAHGGNSPLMTIVATELRVRFDMLAVATSWTRFGYPDGLVSDSERALGIHGGFVETSIMLALRPDLVRMDRAKHFSNAQESFAADFTHLRAYGPHAFGWKMADLNADGVCGDASRATADAGGALLDHAARGFVALLRDIDRFEADWLR